MLSSTRKNLRQLKYRKITLIQLSPNFRVVLIQECSPSEVSTEILAYLSAPLFIGRRCNSNIFFFRWPKILLAFLMSQQFIFIPPLKWCYLDKYKPKLRKSMVQLIFPSSPSYYCWSLL